MLPTNQYSWHFNSCLQACTKWQKFQAQVRWPEDRDGRGQYGRVRRSCFGARWTGFESLLWDLLGTPPQASHVTLLNLTDFTQSQESRIYYRRALFRIYDCNLLHIFLLGVMVQYSLIEYLQQFHTSWIPGLYAYLFNFRVHKPSTREENKCDYYTLYIN